MTNIKKNLFYNILYQMLVVIVPLITSPYLARTLGAESIGVYSYTYSIAFYFMMIAVLGINNYGNRSIAKVKINREKLSLEFSSIYFIQIFMSTIMIISYIIYVYFFVKDYKNIAIIQGLYILANAIDITWFFYGMEEFKVTVLRNTMIKVISLLLILFFVKIKSDLWLYTLIMAGSTLIGQLITWPILLKKVKIVIPRKKDILPHIKPIIILFIPVLAISIFSYMDKIMIGSTVGMGETGYYENAEKILSIPKSLIAALGAVMLPRTANLIAIGEDEKSKMYIENTMFYVLLISSACCFGLAAVSDKFSILFWGNDFKKCGILISIMTPALIFSAFGNVIRTQFLIPKSMDKEYTVSLIIGAIVNMIINTLLIPIIGALGAVIGTVIAEFSLCCYQTYSVRKYLDIKSYIKSGMIFFPIGLIMYILIKFLDIYLKTNIISLVIEIVCGATVFVILSYIYVMYSNDKMPLIIKNKIQFKSYQRGKKII